MQLCCDCDVESTVRVHQQFIRRKFEPHVSGLRVSCRHPV